MARKLIDRSNFWLTSIVGSIMVLLVIALGFSFFNAIYFSQLDSRKEFLVNQTELVSLGLEIGLLRFKVEVKLLVSFLEDPDLDSDFKYEFTVFTRRSFSSFPGMLDSIMVDMIDSTVIFTMTGRNEFIRETATKP